MSIFSHPIKADVDDLDRRLIDEALAAGRFQVIPRGVSGDVDCHMPKNVQRLARKRAEARRKRHDVVRPHAHLPLGEIVAKTGMTEYQIRPILMDMGVMKRKERPASYWS